MPKLSPKLKNPSLIIFSTILLLGAFSVLVNLFFPLATPKPEMKVRAKQSTVSADLNKETKFDFLVFGDSGTGSVEQRKLANLMVNQNARLALHTGDVAYGEGTEGQVQTNVLEVYKELFAQTTFYPVLGNHDSLTNSGQPLLNAFTLPGNERYYSFAYGKNLFIALDTNDSLDASPNHMLPWLEDTLATQAVNKDWVVVYFHHPPYNSGTVHGSDQRVLKKIVPILEKYNVDIVFSGHEHSYQRTCPIRQNTCLQNGIVYIITGGGGAPLYKLGNPQWFTAKQERVYHFVSVELTSCQLTLKAIDINQALIDDYTKSKC